ncbi:MAG: Aspartate dehydrogenase [Hyphomicrobiales bacterium]|nr:Aspartate dehydrogenase [Hyphomicrobiales bacterium]
MIGVGVIGTGALGSSIARSLAGGQVPGVELTAIAGRSRSHRLDALAREWECQATADPLSLADLGANVVVEAAGAEAAREYALPLLGAGCDVVLMSTGALADADFVARLKQVATAASRRIYLPSGSIAGVDGLLSAMESEVHSVRVTTRKHPNALVGAPHLVESATDLSKLDAPLVVFEGNAREAVAGFPSNLNVALTLATAIGDADRVQVRIIADPAATFTSHRIEVSAASGQMTVEMSNLPSATNPRSSWLAALSAVATIRRIASPLWIG